MNGKQQTRLRRKPSEESVARSRKITVSDAVGGS